MNTQKFICVKTATLLFFLISGINSFGQWPQWQGPMRDGVCKEDNLLKVWPAQGPKLLWISDTLGEGFSSTAIQDKMVFTLGKRDSIEIITALDLEGNIKWQNIVGRASKEKDWPQSRCTPTIYQNKVYAITVLGDMACFDTKTGNVDWKMPVFEKFHSKGNNLAQCGIAESPLIVDDKIIITPCGDSTTIVALNRLTGQTIWKSESLKDTTSYTSPVLIEMKNKKAIFTSTLHYDIIVDIENGRIIWKDKHISGMIPVVKNNQIYFTGEYQKGGTLCKWNNELNKLSVLWTDTIKANQIGGAVIVDNKIITSGNSKGLYCLDFNTGKLLSRIDSINYCTLIVAGNRIYSYEDRSSKISLIKLEGNNLDRISSFKIKHGKGPSIAHLAISDGLLFIRRGTVLMAYDIRQTM